MPVGDPSPKRREPAQFDYSTISDVILHVRYTARDGGRLLRTNALAQVKELIASGEASGSTRVFSVRHEFPTEWAKFTKLVPAANHRHEVKLVLRPEHYPFWSPVARSAATGPVEGAITRVGILAWSSSATIPGSLVVADKADRSAAGIKEDALTKDLSMGGLLIGAFDKIALPASPVGDLTFFVDSNAFSDLWVMLTCGE